MSKSSLNKQDTTLQKAGTTGVPFSYRVTPCITLLAVFAFTFLVALVSGTIFFSVGQTSAETTSTDVIVEVDPVLAITTNAASGTLSLPITPTPTGTEATNDLVVTVSTNNSTGYKLTMSSETSSTALSHLILTDTIPSTTAPQLSPAALSVNTWGYSTVSSPTTFSAIPALSTPDTIKTTSAPASTSDTTITFAAYVDSTIAAGDYVDTIVFTATGNAVPITPIISKVSPSTNWTSGDIYITGTNLDSATSITVGGTPCLSYKSISSTSASCVLPAKTNGSVNAVVLTNSLGTSNTTRTVTYDNTNHGYMQTFTSSTCSAMPMGKAEQWTDARDNKQYRIKKMLDNKCWMIDNLAYSGGGTDTYNDVQTLTFADATGSSPWNSTTGTTTRYVTTNNFTGSDLLDRNGNNIENTTAFLANDTQCTNSITGIPPMDSECLSYLYNWCAAIGLDSSTTPTCAGASDAGSGTGYSTTGVIGAPSGQGGESKGSGGTSICPANWRIPVGRIGSSDDSMNEWAILNGSMHNNAYTSTPDIGTGSGYYQNWQPAGSFSSISASYFAPDGGLMNQSTQAVYWSSSSQSSGVTPFMLLVNVFIDPSTGYLFGRYGGLGVRCALSS